MTPVAVVIPFYQREAGILARALRSILAQELEPQTSVEIIVVDDDSPVPAKADVETLTIEPPFSIRVLHRENGGPGAARNTGIAAVSRDTAFVAFLDADDYWREHHLRTAIQALGGDGDVFFCDFQPFGEARSYFNLRAQLLPGAPDTSAGLPEALITYDGESLVRPTPIPHVFAMSGRAATIAFIKCYLAHTSTIVYRRERLDDVRFDSDLRSAGEDYLFGVTLASRARQVVYSAAVGMARGEGVNIYERAKSWDHPDNVKLVLDNFRCFLRMSRRAGSKDLARLATRRAASFRREFAYVWLRQVLLSGSLNSILLAKAFKEDPKSMLLLPFVAAGAVIRKGLGLRLVDHG